LWLKASGVRPGLEDFADLRKPYLGATPLGAREVRQQKAHLFAGALGTRAELVRAREALGRFERASNEFHELPVGLRAKFHKFRGLLPSVHVRRVPDHIDDRTRGFD